jgi:cellulose synthase/poly-beta-1,6-N-acetylglucosamine synthase-like glycosyltransferase
MAIFYISLILFAGYGTLIIYYWLSWKSIPEFFPIQQFHTIKVSVIIPARNEEKNIGILLNALQKQTYPRHLTEVIVVNDHSLDKTAEVAKQFSNIKLINLDENVANSYKKKAIEQGIFSSSGELIITTDADCIPLPGWIETIVAFYNEKKPAFIAAPVALQNNSSIIEIFQSLDFLTLQGITGASVFKKFYSMCNGANLAYEKKAFETVNGFEGIDNIASGDDMLLMHKIQKRFPEKVSYLKSKNVIVSTQPMKIWKDFFNQRIRWASKARFYEDKKIFWTLLLVYLFNLSFLALFIAGFWMHILWLFLVGLWMAKTLIELPFVYSVAAYFNRQSLLKYFFFFQPLHIVYTIIAGWLGQFTRYEWKGRRVR